MNNYQPPYTITPTVLTLPTFNSPSARPLSETWKEIYGSNVRYKAKCCGSDAKDWLEQIRILRDTHGIDPAAWLATVQQETKKAPVANCNFLKKAFLKGCQRAGLFDVIAEEGAAP